jgi:hypothetical protein
MTNDSAVKRVKAQRGIASTKLLNRTEVIALALGRRGIGGLMDEWIDG